MNSSHLPTTVILLQVGYLLLAWLQSPAYGTECVGGLSPLFAHLEEVSGAGVQLQRLLLVGPATEQVAQEA
jgi:hypothetical protein